MTIFAKIENNVVSQVIIADQEFVDNLEGTWLETAIDGSIRQNYAGIGFLYDPIADIFISPQPFPSWTFNKESNFWEPPISYPETLEGAEVFHYIWNEELQSWEIDNGN